MNILTPSRLTQVHNAVFQADSIFSNSCLVSTEMYFTTLPTAVNNKQCCLSSQISVSLTTFKCDSYNLNAQVCSVQSSGLSYKIKTNQCLVLCIFRLINTANQPQFFFPLVRFVSLKVFATQKQTKLFEIFSSVCLHFHF